MKYTIPTQIDIINSNLQSDTNRLTTAKNRKRVTFAYVYTDDQFFTKQKFFHPDILPIKVTSKIKH